MRSIAYRVVLVLVFSSAAAIATPARGQEPVEPIPQTASAESSTTQTTETAPQTGPSGSPNGEPSEPATQTAPAKRLHAFFTIGLGPGGGGTDRFEAKIPTLLTSVGGSIPIRGNAYTDIAMGISIASYKEDVPTATWSGDAMLKTLSLTASLRAGHMGSSTGIFGSAGVGFAYVRFGEPGGFGVYPEPVGSTMAPVWTAAAALEHRGRKPGRFLVELRYSQIDANLGSDAGGTMNAGGPALMLGWRSGP